MMMMMMMICRQTPKVAFVAGVLWGNGSHEGLE